MDWDCHMALYRRAGTAPLAVSIVLALTGCGGGGGLTAKTLTYTERDTNNFVFVDNPPKSTRPLNSRQGPQLSTGDQVGFVGDYLDSRGRKIGRLDATCLITQTRGSFERSNGTCQGTVTLPSGQLFVTVGGPLGTKTTRGAVTGGTGSYAGATGSFMSVGQMNSRDTFRIFVLRR